METPFSRGERAEALAAAEADTGLAASVGTPAAVGGGGELAGHSADPFVQAAGVRLEANQAGHAVCPLDLDSAVSPLRDGADLAVFVAFDLVAGLPGARV
jgi:hypothetical protein